MQKIEQSKNEAVIRKAAKAYADRELERARLHDESFDAAKTFGEGSKGKVFKLGSKGLGFYNADPPLVDPSFGTWQQQLLELQAAAAPFEPPPCPYQPSGFKPVEVAKPFAIAAHCSGTLPSLRLTLCWPRR